VLNQSYIQIIAMDIGSFAYSATSGSLPAGVTVTTGATIAVVDGTPTELGRFTFGVTATNGVNPSVTTYELNVLTDLSFVPVAGRVLSYGGDPVPKAVVTLTDQNGNTRYTRTNGFGYFFFVDVAAGATYSVSISSKQHAFASQTLTIVDAYNNLNITGLP
jgi:hypothetical protein